MMDITFDLQTPNGETAEALAKVVELRRQELGETTKQACVAVAVNVLRSLRAQTKVAKENQMDVKVTLADDRYFPSFERGKGSKGKNVSKRVVRQGQNGPIVTDAKVIWRIGKYAKGQVAHSFEVEDKVSDQKTIQYIIVASSARDAQRYAKQFHKSKVKRHKSLAKFALGKAMKAIYDKGNANDNVTQRVKKIAAKVVTATVRDSGIDKGDVTVHVHDNLDYAALALQSGETSVQTAVQSALNKVVGYLQQRIKQNHGQIDKSLQTTIDELAGKET